MARLGDICEEIVDCPHSTPVWTKTGILVLRTQNIRNGRLTLEQPSYTDERHFLERTRRATPTEGDLVITREAPMGEVCMIPKDTRCCLGQRLVLLRPNRSKVEPRFLLYAVQSKSVRDQIRAYEGTGSTVSNLRIPLIEALSVPVLPLPQQRECAEALGALDDKIELNRRMGRTIDELAVAEFVRSAIGSDADVPTPLTELMEMRRDVVDPRAASAEYFHHYSLPAFDAGKGPDLQQGDEIKSTKFGVPSNAVLVSKLNPRILRVWLPEPPTTGISRIASTEFMVLTPKPPLSAASLYTLWRLPSLRQELVARVTGTSGSHQRVRPDDVLTFAVRLAGDTAIRQFNDFAEPIYQRYIANQQQNTALRELRDALLPQLLAGQVMVRPNFGARQPMSA